MKKKVALLLALSMLMSILPMNVFGVGFGPLSSAPQLIPSTTVTARLTASQRALLWAGTHNLRVQFDYGAWLRATPGSIASPTLINIGPTINAEGNYVLQPQNPGHWWSNTRMFQVAGDSNEYVEFRLNTWMPHTVTTPLPTEPAINGVPELLILEVPNIYRTGSNVVLVIVDEVTGVEYEVLFRGPLGSTVSDAGVTIPTGVVRNPINEWDRSARPFQVTVPISQLFTHPGHQQSAGLRFTLHGPDFGDHHVMFMNVPNSVGIGVDRAPVVNSIGRLIDRTTGASRQNNWATSPAVSYGTPVITVHPDSQIFRAVDNHPIADPHLLFTSGVPGSSRWLPGDIRDTTNEYRNFGRLAVGTPAPRGQSVEAWLSISGLAQCHIYGTELIGFTTGNLINNLSGVLVLEISGIAAAQAGSRITVDRIGAAGIGGGEVVTLVNYQLLAFGTADRGVIFSVDEVRYFSTGLMIGQLRIDERRPQSFHSSWWTGGEATPPGQNGNEIATHPDGRGITTTHQLRLMGPHDHVWNVRGGHETVSGPGLTTGAGLAPLEQFHVTHNTVFGDANTVRVNDVRQYLDPATGRPVLAMQLVVPDRGLFPAQNQIGRITLNGLSIVPVRDGLVGDIYIDISFGRYFGGGFTLEGAQWIPLPAQDDIFTGRPRTTPASGLPLTPSDSRTDGALRTGFIGNVAVSGVYPVYPALAPFTAPQMAALIALGGRVGQRQPHDYEVLRAIGVSPTGVTIPTGTTPENIATRNVIYRNAANVTQIRQVDALRWMPQGGDVWDESDDWHRRGSRWEDRALLVGRRAGAALELRTVGDIPTLISGQRSFPIAYGWAHGTGQPWDDNPRNNEFRYTRTARVQIAELSPGSLNLGWGSSVVYFSVQPQEGVQIMHAAWRIWGDYAGIRTAAPPGSANGWQHVSFRDDDQIGLAGATGVTTLTGDGLRLFVPRADDTPRARNAVRNLEVIFWVSVIAGYEDMFDAEPITVSVAGSAIGALAADNRTVEVAYVEDPIRVHLDGPLTFMEVGQVMSPVEVTRISDVIIEERVIGGLSRGTTFTMQIEALPIPVLGHHAVVDTVAIIESDCGMELRTTRVGTGTEAYIRFEVIRESQREPAVIRLTNNYVMGTFLPGIRYGISISGTPRAAWPTPARIRDNSIAQNTGRGVGGRGNFDMIPYFVDIIEFGAFDPPGLPPGVGGYIHTPPVQPPVTPQPPTRREFVLNESTPSLGGAQFTFPFRILPLTEEYIGSFIMLRPFAYIIGENPHEGGGAVEWFPETQTARITGQHLNGSAVVVELTVGSSNIRVNGTVSDIAELAGQAHLRGRVVPGFVDDRLFLPLRVLTEVYGREIIWNEVTQSVTVR
jgi:hypothetical protein